MTASLDAAFNFTDIAGLAALRREAKADTPEALHAVAQQFEAMFLNMMLQQMRSSVGVDGGLIDREQVAFHEQMFDQQLSLTLSRGNGIGIAEAIVRDFGGRSGVTPAVSAGIGRADPGRAPRGVTAGALDAVAASGPAADRRTGSTDGAPPSGRAARATPSATGADTSFRPRTQEEFVQALWPHAERAAARLGIAPDVLVAQAALESGWGQHQIRGAHGEPSFNLFGVKTGSVWTGGRAQVSTLEFIDGVPQRKREAFRMYGSIRESFDDYVALVRGNARYAPAVSATSAEGYLRGLQAGGYATDPDYADKILGILERGLPGRPVRANQAAVATQPQDLRALF